MQGRGILKRRRPQQGAGADPGLLGDPRLGFLGVCLRIQGHTLGPSEQAAPGHLSCLSLRPQGTGGFRLMARSSGGKDGIPLGPGFKGRRSRRGRGNGWF